MFGFGQRNAVPAGKAATPRKGQGNLKPACSIRARFGEMVQWFKAQGGDPRLSMILSCSPQPTTVVQVKASQPGYVTALMPENWPWSSWPWGRQGHQG